MATIAELCGRGIVEQIEVELEAGELPERLVYCHPRVVKWLENVLPTLQTDGYIAGALTPSEQAATFLHQFIAGRPISSMPPRTMRPESDGIWELRTHDLRFFGWFWKKGVFVLSAIDTKARCVKIQGLYGGYREQSKTDRDTIDLDEPKYILGEIEDVL